jgi:HPt (histidine-containing phosphotransfer) domain-containing protein
MPGASGSSPGTLPETEASPWVDVARVNRLVQETRLRDPEYRKRAFAQFRLDADGLRCALREAGLAGEAGKLKDCAHGLKGLCLTMGLGRLADFCKRIESDSVAGPSPDWSPVPAGFDTAFEASLADLERALGL